MELEDCKMPGFRTKYFVKERVSVGRCEGKKTRLPILYIMLHTAFSATYFLSPVFISCNEQHQHFSQRFQKRCRAVVRH